ncbi:hypothetical protein K0M31_002965 [Melipona bicolor]|uniref:Uncharacterized protein n=1 Tax=Melipona bicolor TaxID=60889 RepID=A0AA40G037_9HYME|nr:hypothetical protein K0M31_002965 [Melipona bicolor]
MLAKKVGLNASIGRVLRQVRRQRHVLPCAWRKSGTSCRGWNTPLAPTCFQHFGQLPVACEQPAISPLSNLVLAAYHRSDDQIT